jgi:hypothetical protein
MVLQADCPWVSDCFCCLVERLLSVGAELARDCGGSVDINVGCDSVIASKLGSYKGLLESGRGRVQIAIASGLGQLTGHFVAQQRG